MPLAEYVTFLSGADPPLPREDLIAVLETYGHPPHEWNPLSPTGRVASFLCEEIPTRAAHIFKQLAYPSWVGRVRVVIDDVVDLKTLHTTLSQAIRGEGDLATEYRGRSLAVRVKLERDPEVTPLVPSLEREIGGELGTLLEAPVDLTAPEVELLVILLPGVTHRVIVAEVLARPTRTGRRARGTARAKHRPFFQVGTMNPPISRIVFNQARCPPGGILLDPFCGSGGILLEGRNRRCHLVGGDINWRFVRGCRKNLIQFGHRQWTHVIQASALCLPFRERTLDAIATDLPYGRAASTSGSTTRDLFHESLTEIVPIISRGGTIIVTASLQELATPDLYIQEPSSRIFEKIPLYQRVHKSLTRGIFRYEVGE